MDAKGKLVRFRAVPRWEAARTTNPAAPAWHEWFPEELTGIDLRGLEPTQERGVPAPDAYDQLQVWKSGPATKNDFYVQAAAFAGRPVYFSVFSPAEFEGRSPSMAMWLRFQPSLASATRQQGESLGMALVILVLLGAVVLAWRNFRLGRGDRNGALRVAFSLFCAGMLSWLFLAMPHCRRL